MTYFTTKLANGTLTESDRRTLEWQRDHMDAIDDDGNILDREPTLAEAAEVLDSLDDFPSQYGNDIGIEMAEDL